MKIALTKQMEEIREFYKDFPHKVYFVGGCVRDLILGLPVHDYDLFTPALPEEIEAHIKSKGRRCYKIGAKFGTLSCKIGPENELVEITTYRADEYDGDSRKPKVTYTDNIHEDLKRRDFTINTIVCDLNGNVKDLTGGLTDLEAGTLRAVGNAKERFKEDPLRILRGIRFAAKYNLGIENNTLKRLESCRWELFRISKERIISELNKILKLIQPEKVETALILLWQLKTWQVVFPAMQLQEDFEQNNPNHDFKLAVHTRKVVMNIKREPIYRTQLPYIWACLLHDVAKPFTQTLHKSGERCNYIGHEILGAEMANEWCIINKFSNDDRKIIVDGIRNHIQPDSWMKQFDDAGKKK